MYSKKSFLFLSLCLILCKGSTSIPDAFKDDIISARHVDFKFDPNNLPVIGVTKEKELDRMYPEGPTGRTTFIKPRRIMINKNTFDFDRRVDYMYMKSEDLSKPPEIIQSRGVESLLLTVFIKNGVVVFYLINHRVKNDKEEWIPGKYNQRDITDENWISTDYKGANQDGCFYWMQWPREARYQYIGNAADGRTEKDCLNMK